MSYQNAKLVNLEDAHKILERLETERFAPQKADIDELADTKADGIEVTMDNPSSVMSFSDGANGLPMSAVFEIAPVQDLHGQSNPYPGGAGKNLLPMTVQNLKSMNTDGIWSDNVYTYRSVTYTVNTDDGGNVVSIKANGTTTYDSYIIVADSMNAILTAGNEYTLSGCPANGSRTTYAIIVGTGPGNSRIYLDEGSGDTATYTSTYAQTDRKCFVTVFAGNTATNLIFTPMMRLSSASADFAPYSNICPITGWTGANVSRTGVNQLSSTVDIGKRWYNGEYQSVTTNNISANQKISCFPNTMYCVSIPNETSTTALYIQEYDRNKNLIRARDYISVGTTNKYATFTTNSDAYYFTWYCYKTTAWDSAEIVNISINYPATDTSYHAYVGTTLPISWQSTAGTVYGGTLTVNKDGTGTLKVDRAILMGLEDYTINLYTNQERRRFEFNTNNNQMPRAKRTNACITSHFKAVSTADLPFGNFTLSVGENIDYYTFYDKDEKFVDVSAFKSWIQDEANNGTPVQIVMELATPVTYQLTVGQVTTLLGLNNLWCDTGNVLSADYSADTKTYVDGKISDGMKLIALLLTANHENGMKASKAYASGNLLTVGNKLYKATTSIANGATLTAGTNVTETTIETELAALA